MKNRVIMVGLAATGAFLLSLIAYRCTLAWGQANVTDAVQAGATRYFTIDNKRTLNQGQGMPTPFWRVFFYLSDNRYWEGTYDNFVTQQVTSTTAQSYTANAELTPCYEEEEPPPPSERAAPTTVTFGSNVTSGTAFPARPNLGNRHVRLHAVRQTMASDITTFVVDYRYPECADNSGSIVFFTMAIFLMTPLPQKSFVPTATKQPA